MSKMQCKVKLEKRRKVAQAFFTACARGFAEVERGTWRLLYWCSWDAVLINQLYWLALRTMGHHLHQLLTLTWGCPWKRWNVWGILSENARWMGLFSTLQVLAKVWGRNSSQWPCQESTSLCGSAPPDSSTILHKCGTAFLLWGPGCHWPSVKSLWGKVGSDLIPPRKCAHGQLWPWLELGLLYIFFTMLIKRLGLLYIYFPMLIQRLGLLYIYFTMLIQRQGLLYIYFTMLIQRLGLLYMYFTMLIKRE